MLDSVNEIVRDLIQSRVPKLNQPGQVGFEPPDDQWKTQVSQLPRLNIYMYEIREDLKYRASDRSRTIKNGWVNESRPPERIDCHYLITAWSSIKPGPGSGLEPTLEEHSLLYSVLAILMENRPLIPAVVYSVPVPSGNDLSTVPIEIRNDTLPLEAALSDQIRDLGDFWGSMKVAWRPTVGLTLTVPVLPGIPDTLTPPVTTLTANWLEEQETMPQESLLSIGGRVLTGAGDTGVPDAWVQISGISANVAAVNQHIRSHPDGIFRFDRLRAGQYHLRCVAAGLGDIGRDTDVPSASGEYDLRFP
jgi:hypothetical protein